MELEVVERAKHGDHAAYASLVRDVGARLYGIALRVTGNAAMADDAVQEGLIHAWRDLPALRDPTRFEAWITQIVIRRCYREIRRSPDRTTALADTDDRAAPGDPASGLAARDEVESAMRRLTPAQRSVLVLRFYAGLEPSEIADVLDLPVGTVRSRLHYALQAMRAAMAAEARDTPGQGAAE